MATCEPGECKELDKIHDNYNKTHEIIIKQTTALEMFMNVVERDRVDRKHDMDKLFTKVNAVDKGLEGKADKEKVITKSGATIFIAAVGVLATISGVAYAVLG